MRHTLIFRLEVNSYIGMALGYIVLTSAYYTNQFNGRDLLWMSNSLFGSDGTSLYVCVQARLISMQANNTTSLQS